MIEDNLKNIKCEAHHHPFEVVTETDFKAEFLPCPFCGSKNIKVKEEYFLDPHVPIGAYCLCGNCFSKIALCIDKKTAVEIWNGRSERTAKVTRGAYDLMRCECGMPVSSNYDYCPKCGARLEWSEHEID